MQESRLSNFAGDLKKARQQALLIEVLENDFQTWQDESEDTFRTVCNLCSAIFDTDTPEGKTNVLVVGSDKSQPTTSLFGSVLFSLGDEFSDLHRRELLGKLAAFGLNKTLGAGVSSSVSDSLSVGVEKMMDYVAEWTGGATDYLSFVAAMITDEITEEASNLLKAIGKVGAEAIAGQFSSKDEFYLSRPAIKRFKEIAPRLSAQATSHEALQLALEMLLVVSHGAPKVIIINDPYRLDDASLALLAMLVSLEKDLHHIGPNNEDDEAQVKTTGISIVLAFTGKPSQEKSSATELVDKKEAVSRLRMMAARYNLLERLDSDIPVPAVRSSTFVGRDEELGQIREGWGLTCQRANNTDQTIRWCLIKGEPGTGKTSLANYFIHQTRSDAGHLARLSIPVLRMLNQTGHNAQATGLASLKNSMAEELRRLALVYQENVGWFSRFGKGLIDNTKAYVTDAVSDDPEARKRTLARAGKLVAELAGISAAVGIAQTAKSWKDQGKTLQGSEKSFSESSKGNYKEEQYELLRKGLGEIRNLARKCLPKNSDKTKENLVPVLLLVDDLQWLDDFTAEFLLNEWPESVPVFIIATARGSDSFTTTGESESSHAANQHRNRLFSELGLIDSPRGASESGEREPVMEATQLYLKGMDQPMLSELIRLTYAEITPEQSAHFAEGTIRNLSVDSDSSQVVTLFAVETLNVISDPQFYRRNPALPQLIERVYGSQHYRFRPPTDAPFSVVMNDVFDKLKKSYEASYVTQDSGEGVKFSLASFAVLEERLHLIEQYFGEYGGTARYSLMFSALLGSPFSNELVQHVIETLQELKPEDHPDLAPFLNELHRETRAGFRPEAYELLEQAYEIVRRLDERASVGGKYVHQHSLMQQFLGGQFTQSIKRAYPKHTLLAAGIESLYSTVETAGDKWFIALEKFEKENSLKDSDLTEENLRFKVALSRHCHQLMAQIISETPDWSAVHADNIEQLSDYYTLLRKPEEALPLHNEAMIICQGGYQRAPEMWAEKYSTALTNLASTYATFSRIEEALELEQKALSIRREGFQSNPDHWAKLYAMSLVSIAKIHHAIGESCRRRDLLEEAVVINRHGYKGSPESWAENFVMSLVDFGDAANPAYASIFFEHALNISRRYQKYSPEKWSDLYGYVVGNYAIHWGQYTLADDALPLFDEALPIYRERYEKFPDQWAGRYAKLLSDIAHTHLQSENPDKAFPLQKRALDIRRRGYEQSPEIWLEDFCTSLHELAQIYKELDQMEEARVLLEESVAIYRNAFETSPRQYAQPLFKALFSLAEIYSDKSYWSDALTMYKQALDLYLKDYPTLSGRLLFQADCLGGIASCYMELGKYEAAFEILSEGIAFFKEIYENDPNGRTAGPYLQFLEDYGQYNKIMGRTAQFEEVRAEFDRIFKEFDDQAMNDDVQIEVLLTNRDWF